MTTELKQAAQQALLALEKSQPDPSNPVIGLTKQDFIDHEETIRQLRAAIQQTEAQQPATGEPVQAERDQLRCAQADAVMPLIGPLLDAWENADREVMSQEPELSKQLKNINSAMEDADTHPAPSVPDGYALVRIEPTVGMLIAGAESRISQEQPTREHAVWAAMLAAK